MGKSIKISLLPSKKDKLYQPKPDFSDLYILMNKLHFHSVNSTVEEEKSTLGDLELEIIKVQEDINKHYQEESTLNVLNYCLEKIDRQVKKQQMANQVSSIELSELKDFNKIIDESELNIKKSLAKISFDEANINTENLLHQVEENLKLIIKHKKLLTEQISNLNDYMSKVETLKENINASTTDIDSLEIALKNLELP